SITVPKSPLHAPNYIDIKPQANGDSTLSLKMSPHPHAENRQLSGAVKASQLGQVLDFRGETADRMAMIAVRSL
ncbi:MAG: hypothetical protein QF609_11545, partial [Gammaproteobacteria bacterium]|nr:hypothetical protein [Gammaproteobacteria bacterium]